MGGRWDDWGQHVELSSEQYGQVVNWMDRQQRRITELEAENRELRRQLEELRRGVGVSVVIEGRALPVAALPTTGLESAITPPTSTSQYPAFQPSIARTSVSRPAYPASPPYPQYPTYSRPTEMQPAWPMPSEASLPQRAPRSAPAPDSTWLTGQMRAVRAPVSRVEATGSRPAATNSQSMTPTWLREELPLPAPSIPSAPSWPSTAMPSMPKPRTLASATGKQPAIRSPLRQGQAAAPFASAQSRRPVAPRLEPEHLPSLAQMTGHRPAVRLSGKPDAERSPFSDSFVLG